MPETPKKSKIKSDKKTSSIKTDKSSSIVPKNGKNSNDLDIKNDDDTDLYKRLFGDDKHKISGDKPLKGNDWNEHNNSSNKSSKRNRNIKDNIDIKDRTAFLEPKKSKRIGNYKHDRKIVDITPNKRLSEFLCTIKYKARLPNPPLKPKFLRYPHKLDRFTKYNGVNLELNYKWDYHFETLIPLNLDLMDPNYYKPINNNNINSNNINDITNDEDERILMLLNSRNESDNNGLGKLDLDLSQPFLLDSKLLTSTQDNAFISGYKKNLMKNNNNNNNDNIFNNINKNNRINNQNKIEMIQNSFNIEIKRHPRKKHLTVKKQWFLFPNDSLLEPKYIHVQFKNDPINHVKKLPFINRDNYTDYNKHSRNITDKNLLLRCIRKNRIENSIDSDDINTNDIIDEKTNPLSWISLYAKNDTNNNNNFNSNSYEWVSEHSLANIENKQMYFMYLEQNEMFYGRYNKKLSIRHKPTDKSVVNGKEKKGLSDRDKRYFNQQPRYLNIQVQKPDEYEQNDIDIDIENESE